MNRLTTSLADWIANAEPGERVIVQTSPQNASKDVARAREAGLITTAQKRANGHSFHLIAIRTDGKPKTDKAPLGRGQANSWQIGHRRVSIDDPELQAMVTAMKARGATHDEVMRELGISKGTVVRIMQKHREASA